MEEARQVHLKDRYWYYQLLFLSIQPVQISNSVPSCFLFAILPLCHGYTEPERLPTQHCALALLDRLLLLALLPKFDEAITSVNSDNSYASSLHGHTLHTWHYAATYNEKQNIMGIIMVELKLDVLLLT